MLSHTSNRRQLGLAIGLKVGESWKLFADESRNPGLAIRWGVPTRPSVSQLKVPGTSNRRSQLVGAGVTAGRAPRSHLWGLEAFLEFFAG